MLRFFIIFLIVMYLIGFVAKWAIKRWIKNINKSNNNYNNYSNKPEGEVTLKYNKAKDKKIKKDEGEYIDYEEVN